MKNNILKHKSMLLMLMALAVSLGTATYAWFVVGRVVQIDPITIDASTSGDLKIAAGKIVDTASNAFGNTADLSTAGYTGTEVSGNVVNGTATFFKDAGTTARAADGTPTSWGVAASPTDYVVQEISFLVADRIDVYLSDVSFITNEIGSVRGAVRVAFEEFNTVTSKYEQRMIWAPYTTLASTQNYISAISPYTEASYTFVKGNLPLQTQSAGAGSNGKICTVNTTFGVPGICNVRVTIWLDGKDPDAIYANLLADTATWKTGLSFVGVPAGS